MAWGVPSSSWPRVAGLESWRSAAARNADYARGLGAADVIDYSAGDVAEAVRSRYPDGIDAVADMHGDAEQVGKLTEQVSSGG